MDYAELPKLLKDHEPKWSIPATEVPIYIFDVRDLLDLREGVGSAGAHNPSMAGATPAPAPSLEKQ